MKREFAILGIIIALGIGILGGWFIPSPITTTRTPLLDQIKARGELIVGTSADYPPFENFSYPYTGEIEGFDVDVAQLIADELGVTLTMTNLDFGSLISACSAGTIDMIAAAMTYNEERAQSLAASVTYITVSQVVVVKEASPLMTITNLTYFEDKPINIGVQTGTVMHDELLTLTNVSIIASPNAVTVMTNLLNDVVDCVYIDEPIFTAYNQTENLRIIYGTGSEPLALWTRYGEPELLYTINNVILSAYLDGSMYTLIDNWFG
ncbi:MAG: substrate-binding periplasmic protein [Candidatus Hermodarchaeota archaeon]